MDMDAIIMIYNKPLVKEIPEGSTFDQVEKI